VLGKTGRNFAAGMSGGVAYVFDEDGDFAIRCNQSMVSLEPLDDSDAAKVKALIHEHYSRTQSALAWRVLSGWKENAAHFVKVMPTEYRKVLAKAHLDSDAAKLASI
jgi:glutamate synthase domain-containing protein 3